MLVVLDTNVLVSGLLSPKGPPAWLVELVIAQELTCVLNPQILAEYRDVLHRRELGLPGNIVDTLLESVEGNALHVTPRPLQLQLPDPDDEPFLACAKETNSVLVTGNLKHFPARLRAGVRVFSPREAIDFLRLEGIARGEEALAEGRSQTHAQAKKRLGRWLK